MDPGWQSNTWLVGDRPGGAAVLIDSGGPLPPILAAVAEHDLHPSHVLCTHHHHDHIAHNTDYAARFGCRIVAHPDEVPLMPAPPDDLLEDGAELIVGALRIRALHIPGHTVGQLALRVGDEHVFTGDTLFAGSIGGNRGPGHGTFEQLRHSIMEVLMRLPSVTVVHPGHQGETTIAREWEHNPFVRYWRGLDEPSPQPCHVGSQSATLLVSARDYDGGQKCLVRSRTASTRSSVARGCAVDRRHFFGSRSVR